MWWHIVHGVCTVSGLGYSLQFNPRVTLQFVVSQKPKTVSIGKCMVIVVLLSSLSEWFLFLNFGILPLWIFSHLALMMLFLATLYFRGFEIISENHQSQAAICESWLSIPALSLVARSLRPKWRPSRLFTVLAQVQALNEINQIFDRISKAVTGEWD